MIKKLMHNWQWKLLALIIAFALWAMIVNIQDPLATIEIEDVPVTIENIEEITSRGLAVEYKDGETVDLILRGKRSLIEELTIEDVFAYADFGRISVTGAVEIKIEAGDQIEVMRKTPNEMLIVTEEIKKEVKSVQVRFEGDLAKDYVKLSAIVTPNQIEITGPESKLALVSSVVVPIDISEASDDVTVFRAPQLLDSSGDEVRDVAVSKDQIQIKVPVQMIKAIPVVVTTTGELDVAYRLISMEIQTANVTIRGEEEDIENITRLSVNDIDITAMTDATTSVSLNLSNYLPEGVYIYNPAAMTTLDFDIQPIITTSYIIEQADINVVQIPEGLQFQFIDEEPYVINVKGIYKELAELDVEDMLPRISLDSLKVGEQTVELQLTLPEVFELSDSVPMVRVELTEAPVEGIDDGLESTTSVETTTLATE